MFVNLIEKVIKALQTTYKLKEESIRPSEHYLGAQVSKYSIPGSDDPKKPRWAMSSEKYTKAAIRDVEMELEKADKRLVNRTKTPMTPCYKPEMDLSHELNPDTPLPLWALLDF
jgi:hypothetical protein